MRSKPDAASAEDQSLLYVLQARVALDGSEYLSQFVQLNVAKFLNRASFLRSTLKFRLFFLNK